MSVTVKNVSTGYISLPRPFVTTLAAGGSVTKTGLSINGIAAKQRQQLQDMANAGKITMTETDEVLARGTPADANTADIHQILSAGQGTAANGAVEANAACERPCQLKEVTVYFDTVPNAGASESITVDLTRNGTSILSTALVADDSTPAPSVSAVLAPGATDQTDGVTSTADPDRFSAATYTFTAADVGNLLFINSGGSNDGVYIITNYVDADNVDCTDLEGAAPGWTTESGIEFDVVLSVQPGDILNLTGTMANNTDVNYWVAQAVLVPR